MMDSVNFIYNTLRHGAVLLIKYENKPVKINLDNLLGCKAKIGKALKFFVIIICRYRKNLKTAAC